MSNDKFDSCLIFAHRGANREAAENTRAAFDKALEYAIDVLRPMFN
jgi:glycerophosphoryl diester phosphodiesterase